LQYTICQNSAVSKELKMKMKCPKCKHYVDDHDADCCTDIHCQCDNSAPEAQQAAEQKIRLTAFGVGLAALFVNDVVLLAVIMAVIGGR